MKTQRQASAAIFPAGILVGAAVWTVLPTWNEARCPPMRNKHGRWYRPWAEVAVASAFYGRGDRDNPLRGDTREPVYVKLTSYSALSLVPRDEDFAEKV